MCKENIFDAIRRVVSEREELEEEYEEACWDYLDERAAKERLQKETRTEIASLKWRLRTAAQLLDQGKVVRAYMVASDPRP